MKAEGLIGGDEDYGLGDDDFGDLGNLDGDDMDFGDDFDEDEDFGLGF